MDDDRALTVRIGDQEAHPGEWSFTSNYLVPTDTFRFTLTGKEWVDPLGLMWQPVELLLTANDVTAAPQMLGRIEVVTTGESELSVTCEGRDHLADAVTSDIDTKFSVTDEMDLVSVLRGAFSPVGITDIGFNGDIGLRNVRTGKTPAGASTPGYDTIKVKDIAPRPGQKIFEWCNRLCARNGCTIQPGIKRNQAFLSEPDYDQEPLGQIRRSPDQLLGLKNNVLRAPARRDGSRVPTFSLFTGKEIGGASRSRALSRTGAVEDMLHELSHEVSYLVDKWMVGERRVPDQCGPLPENKFYRLLLQEDKEAKNREQLDKLARRAFSERVKDLLRYPVELDGYGDPGTGALWGVNTMIDVQDDVAKVFEPLWVMARSCSWSRGRGARTNLVCLRKGALVLS